MLTMNDLNKFWHHLNLNQQIIILKTIGIESVEVYHLSYDRYLTILIDDCEYINFHQLTKAQQKQVLKYVNKTPAKYKILNSVKEIQAEFDLKIDKRGKMYD